mgnify:CR=1 FL=1
MTRLKRLEVPGHWPIEKKTKKYTVTSMPGPHARSRSLTIAVVLREVLGFAENLREVREILNAGAVKVDGHVGKKTGFPVGLMDVLTIGEEHYRVLPGKHGLYIKRLEKKEAGFKLQKISGKTTIKKGKTQLHFHDGTNLIADGSYRTGDVAVFDMGTQKIRDIIKQERGAKVVVIKGNSRGAVGELEEIKTVKGPGPNIATIAAAGRKITLPLDYVFPVGKTEPIIALGEDEGVL